MDENENDELLVVLRHSKNKLRVIRLPTKLKKKIHLGTKRIYTI